LPEKTEKGNYPGKRHSVSKVSGGEKRKAWGIQFQIIEATVRGERSNWKEVGIRNQGPDCWGAL
jgi:hypothetical protein